MYTKMESSTLLFDIDTIYYSELCLLFWNVMSTQKPLASMNRFIKVGLPLMTAMLIPGPQLLDVLPINLKET